MGKNAGTEPLPAWSKVLMAFVVAFMVTMTGGMLLAILTVKKTFEHAQKPVYIERIAQQIAQLPAVLPKGYSYYFGVDLGLCRIVDIDFKHGRQQILLFGYQTTRPSAEKALSGRTEAARMLTRVYNLGITTPRVQSGFKRMISHGAWTIQGKRIPYLVGELSDIEGTAVVACYVDGTTGRSMLLYSVQRGHRQFDMKVLTVLLQEIQGFPSCLPSLLPVSAGRWAPAATGALEPAGG